jgi:hypothetical protein
MALLVQALLGDGAFAFRAAAIQPKGLPASA